jgi:hypothetical protein
VWNVTSRQIVAPQTAAIGVAARNTQTTTPNVKLTKPARSA